jgi:G3E family GTPase
MGIPRAVPLLLTKEAQIAAGESQGSVNELEENWMRNGRPRLVAMGGYLGAGKTTAISRLAALFKKMGRGVAIITTATGGESVDTLRLRELGFPTAEASERAPRAAIWQAVEQLGQAGSTDVVLMEMPGGSARVGPPAPGPELRLAPLTVIVDPSRAAKILGLEPGNPCSESISYLYRKQLEQASLIVINRSDSVAPNSLAALRQALDRQTRNATILELAAATDSGLEEWLHCLGRQEPDRVPVDWDSKIVSQAERSIAAVNCAVQVSTV